MDLKRDAEGLHLKRSLRECSDCECVPAYDARNIERRGVIVKIHLFHPEIHHRGHRGAQRRRGRGEWKSGLTQVPLSTSVFLLPFTFCLFTFLFSLALTIAPQRFEDTVCRPQALLPPVSVSRLCKSRLEGASIFTVNVWHHSGILLSNETSWHNGVPPRDFRSRID